MQRLLFELIMYITDVTSVTANTCLDKCRSSKFSQSISLGKIPKSFIINRLGLQQRQDRMEYDFNSAMEAFTRNEPSELAKMNQMIEAILSSISTASAIDFLPNSTIIPTMRERLVVQSQTYKNFYTKFKHLFDIIERPISSTVTIDNLMNGISALMTDSQIKVFVQNQETNVNLTKEVFNTWQNLWKKMLTNPSFAGPGTDQQAILYMRLASEMIEGYVAGNKTKYELSSGVKIFNKFLTYYQVIILSLKRSF